MGQQGWLCSYLVFFIFWPKSWLFVRIKLFLKKKKKMYGCYVQTIAWRGSDARFPCKYETLENIGYVIFCTGFS